MEENVALDSNKQKKFVKSIKGIKKLIKKGDAETEVFRPLAPKTDDEKPKKKRSTREKGLVYLSHIPHGFYEHQMTQYFKQFGKVTNARVIRSKKTGNSKGCAFVEFAEPTVAQIVTETMNNYLMGKRLIKAEYVPPEKQKHAFRKHWTNKYNPGQELQMKLKKKYNGEKSDLEELNRARKLLANLSKTKKKLSDIGIDYNFFMAVDIPEALTKKEAEPEEEIKPVVQKTKSIEKNEKVKRKAIQAKSVPKRKK